MPKIAGIKSIVLNSRQRVEEFLPYIHNITYTSETLGESTLDFTMLRGGILPKIGDAIEIIWGYGDNSVPDLNTGTLVIDTRESKWGTDTTLFSAKAYVGELQISSLYEYEGKSLREIVADKANIAELQLNNPSDISDVIVGVLGEDKDGNDTPPTETFNGSHLQQLASLARKYAYSFRIKFGVMYFEDLYEIYNQTPILNFVPSTVVVSPRFRVRVDSAIEASTAAWRIQGSDESTTRYLRVTSSHDVTVAEVNLISEGVYGNRDAAARRNFGELMKGYLSTFTGQVTIEGNGKIEANEVIVFRDFYRSPFRMVVSRATHTLNKGGWKTAMDLWRRPTFVDI